MHLGGLAMGLTNIRLGDYIERSTQNNKDLEYGTDLIVGVNSQGIFAVPKGNTDGVDLKPYKIVNDGAFVYNPTRLELGSIAYRTEGLCIVSHLYMVFYLTDEGKKIIDPMWLYIYFRRAEFCREVTFRNFGSQRPEFNFNDMSDIIVPLPDIKIQRKYVDIYNAMLANQQSYEHGLDDLKLSFETLIDEHKHKAKSIVEFSVKRRVERDSDSDYSEQIVPFQIAYAVSIHKAQGLEYKSVKVVITEDIDEKISHNIFYTAITRTTDKLKIYMSKETQKKLAEKFVKSNVGLKQAQLFAGQAGLKLKNKLSS